MLDAAEQDHAQVMDALQQLAAAPTATEADQRAFDARVREIDDGVRRHVADEERTLFAVARDSALDLVAVGAQMALRQRQLLSSAQSLD